MKVGQQEKILLFEEKIRRFAVGSGKKLITRTKKESTLRRSQSFGYIKS